MPGNFLNTNVPILWSKEDDYKHISDSLLAVDWNFQFDSRSLKVCFSYFVHFMKILIDSFVLSSHG